MARGILNRSRDIAGALGGLLFFAPVMLASAFAILIDDGFPILFLQRRIGANRRPFVILKFRSMRDGRVTRVGRVLRATGSDELPQFLNILRGELSVVGPRPLTAADVDRLGWAGPAHDFRSSVPPGLTGLAQIIGTNGARQALFLDRRYIRDRTIWIDLRLIGLSFAVNALGKRRMRRWLLRRGRRRARENAPAAPFPSRSTAA